MLEQALISLVRSTLLAELPAGVEVLQKNNPVSVGASSTPTVYIEVIIPGQRYGWLSRKERLQLGLEAFDHEEMQWISTTLQISGLARLVDGQPSAADLTQMAADILQGDAGLAAMAVERVRPLRITSSRVVQFVNDAQQFEANPSFDIVLNHVNLRTSTTPAVSVFEGSAFTPGDEFVPPDPPNPPEPPVPGPLDYIETGENLPSITVEYGLARPVAMLGVAFRHTGTVTTLTATHGGEPLELVGFVLNDADNIGAAAFIGNGLTIEPENLVITPVGGGGIGPAVLRIDDSFAIDDVAVGLAREQFGYSYIGAARQPDPIVFNPVSGDGWGVYALAAASAEKESFARGLAGAGPVEQLFWGVASSGTLKDVPPWRAPAPTSGWSQDGEWWTHTGASSYLVGELLPDLMGPPFWIEVEIDVEAGSRIYIQTLSQGGYLSQLYMGPVSEVVRIYRSQSVQARGFQVQSLGNARFRNFKYCDDGMTVFGAFGRTTNPVPQGSSLQFQIGALSRYAGVVAEVHDA